MAESTKYMPVHNGFSSQSQDLHKFTNIFSFKTTKKTKAFAYIFISVFIAFTVFLAFNPSPNPSSPWFSNIFTSTTLKANSTTPSSSSSSSIRSHFSSIYSYLFNSTNSTVSGSVTVNRGDRNITHSEGEFTRSQGEVRSNQTKVITNSDGEIRSNQTKVITHSEGEIGGQIRSNQSSVNTQGGGVVGEKKGVNQTSVNAHSGGEIKSANQTGVHNNNNTHNEGEIKGVNGVKNMTHSEGVVGETVKNSNQSTVGDFRSKQSSVTEKGAKSGNENDKASVGKNDEGEDEMVKKLVKCELFDGEWVKDESYPLYKPGSCSLIDEQFNCYNNGRPDKGFQMLKWKPKACTLPRLDGSKMLQMLRGKRLVFVGDSLNRNMWESLICILKNSVKDQTKVYEASGRHHFRSEPSYSFVFKDYNCTVEFFVAPFIVRESETKDKNGAKKETLRLDLVGTSADQYKQADIIVFNTGHWWTHEKTAKGKDYYQEGSHVYNELNVLEAFRKAMTTWGRWVDAHINPSKTLVFFRGYSASHFRGGQWNSGGQCDNEVEPIKNTTYLSPYPDKMKTLEKVLRGMKTRVSYLNITRLTDFRKDGHPSIYRKQHYSEVERRSPLHFQDCSHWCLPGVPDSWNELLYAELLAKQYQNQHQKN